MTEKMKIDKTAMRNYKDGSTCRAQAVGRWIT